MGASCCGGLSRVPIPIQANNSLNSTGSASTTIVPTTPLVVQHPLLANVALQGARRKMAFLSHDWGLNEDGTNNHDLATRSAAH